VALILHSILFSTIIIASRRAHAGYGAKLVTEWVRRQGLSNDDE